MKPRFALLLVAGLGCSVEEAAFPELLDIDFIASALPGQHPPPNLVLTAPLTAERGTTLTLSLTTGTNFTGGSIFFPSTEDGIGAGSCPAVLAGSCLDVVGAIDVLGPSPLVNGDTTLLYDVPLNASDNLYVQAVAKAGGGVVYLSNPVAVEILDPLVGCGFGDGVPGEDVDLTFDWDGVERTWVLHLPTDYDCTPRPLILGAHGYYGSGSGFQNNTSQMFDRIDEEGWIGVFPDGLSMGGGWFGNFTTSFNDLGSRFDDGPDGLTCIVPSYDYGEFDNCPPDEATRICKWGTSCADTVGFFRALIEHAQTEWTVDADRIYLTGFSQGGQTAQSMACPLSDILAAVAPGHGFAANGYTCGPETKLSMMQVWGVNDNTVNGHDEPSSDGLIYDGADETALEWAIAQDCDLATTTYPTVSDGKDDWACTQHANCATGGEVVTCSWDGGHSWGRNQADGNFALDAMMDFFIANPR